MPIPVILKYTKLKIKQQLFFYSGLFAIKTRNKNYSIESETTAMLIPILYLVFFFFLPNQISKPLTGKVRAKRQTTKASIFVGYPKMLPVCIG